MIEITEEMADTAALAVLNATRAQTRLPPLRKMPIGQWNRGQLTFEVKAAIAAVAPLIAAQAAAAEREACAQIAWGHAPVLIDCDAMKIHDAIRARGDKP